MGGSKDVSVTSETVSIHTLYSFWKFVLLIEMFEMFTDLFVLVDNIDSASLIAPVRLIWELSWKRWQRKLQHELYEQYEFLLWRWWSQGWCKFQLPVRSLCAWVLRWWHRRVRPRLCRSLPLSGQSRTRPGENCFSHHPLFTFIIALTRSLGDLTWSFTPESVC